MSMNSPTISGRRYLWDDSGWPAKPVEATVNEVHRFAWPNVEAEAIQRRQTKRAVATQRSDGDCVLRSGTPVASIRR
jgi:hypothetical protein